MDTINDNFTSSLDLEEMAGFTFYPWVLSKRAELPAYDGIVETPVLFFSSRPTSHVGLRGRELSKVAAKFWNITRRRRLFSWGEFYLLPRGLILIYIYKYTLNAHTSLNSKMNAELYKTRSKFVLLQYSICKSSVISYYYIKQNLFLLSKSLSCYHLLRGRSLNRSE